MQREFRFSPTVQRAGLGIMALVGVVYVFLTPRDLLEEDPTFAVVFFATLLLLFVLGAYEYLRHTGSVVLTDDAVVLRRFGSEKRLKYEEITGTEERDLHIPPNYTLYGNTTRLKFSRQVEDFAAFYELLHSRTPALGEENVSLPLTLELAPHFYVKIALAVGGFVVILANLLLFTLSTSEIPFSDIFFGGLAILFVLALFVATVMPGLRNKPVKIILTPDEIRIHPLIGEPVTYPSWKIRSITIEERTETVTLPHRTVLRTMEATTHPLVIRFTGGQELVISEQQAWDLGHAPERLHLILRKLY